MPEDSVLTRAAYGLRKYRQVHEPLRWLRHVFWRQALGEAALEFLRQIMSSRSSLGPPRRVFSIYQHLLRTSDPRAEGEIILEDQGNPPLEKCRLQIVSDLYQHATQPWPIVWSRHRNARLVSSTLALLNDEKRLMLESVYGYVCLRDDPAFRYISLPEPVRLAGNWTSVISRWVPSWRVPTFTHWVLDALPRLALLSKFPPDTRVLVPLKLAGYQKETIELLGLSDRIRHTSEEHLEIENYYFSAPTAMIDCYNPYGVKFLRSAFLPKGDTNYSGPRKFVIRRVGKTRGIQNDEEVSKFLAAREWAMIDTEKLTFAQEITLFSQAEAICGVLGSGFTNTIWCQPGCKVVCLVPDSFIDGYMEWIAAALDLEFHFKIFPSDHAMRAHVPLDELSDLLSAAGA